MPFNVPGVLYYFAWAQFSDEGRSRFSAILVSMASQQVYNVSRCGTWSKKGDMNGSESDFKNGEISEIDDLKRIFFDGYWIRYYGPPEETWTAKKNLIVGLTRRTFHHTEPGINTPGENLDLARAAYQEAKSKAEKRVNAAMLAGALFNRAIDIITSVVELEDKGVHISWQNELVQQCGDCLTEAMELGKSVRHFSGNEGIDELWGEPLKVFSLSTEGFYESRYVKIAQTMRDIDRINEILKITLQSFSAFTDAWPLMTEYAKYAKLNCEIMKTDPDYFSIWPKFVTCSERLQALVKEVLDQNRGHMEQEILDGCGLFEQGRNLITYISGARVPMPKTMNRFLEDCDGFAHGSYRAQGGRP